MDKELLLENIEMEVYSHGKATLVAGMCKKLNVINIFDQYLTKQNGRKPDISYGTIAQMMLANLCHSRRPLYIKCWIIKQNIRGVQLNWLYAIPSTLKKSKRKLFLDMQKKNILN